MKCAKAPRWWCCCRTTADVDIKLASRVRGLMPSGWPYARWHAAIVVSNPAGDLVTNAGSGGKFLGVLRRPRRESGRFRYKLRCFRITLNPMPRYRTD